MAHGGDQSHGQSDEAMLVAIEGLQERVKLLEEPSRTPFSWLKTQVTVIGLFLGFTITVASVWDTFVSKPKQDEIARLTEFNQAINSVSAVMVDLAKSEQTITSPDAQMALQSAAKPQILADLSTATAFYDELDDNDIQIPQLEVLSFAAVQAGDLNSAQKFADRAVKKTGVSPFLHADAERNQATLYEQTQDMRDARASFKAAVAALSNDNMLAASRAYVLEQWLMAEYYEGDCGVGKNVFDQFVNALRSPYILAPQRMQMSTTARNNLLQLAGHHCAAPSNLDELAQASGSQAPG